MTGDDLVVDDLTVDFGGLRAVDGLSLVARAGQITGLIGPNGAGKTTTFNACTGTVHASGTVTLGTASLTGLPPHRRAQLGLGRTFQRMELVDSLTVTENVLLGATARRAGRRPWHQVAGPRAERRDLADRARQAVHDCGLDDVADQPTSGLSTGRRRLVEFARVVAAGFDLLLLDEPSSGLDERETVIFGDHLEWVVEATGVGVLLVEHDISLVRRLCTRTSVLDFGQLLLDGSTGEVLASDVVRRAYLGTEAAA